MSYRPKFSFNQNLSKPSRQLTLIDINNIVRDDVSAYKIVEEACFDFDVWFYFYIACLTSPIILKRLLINIQMETILSFNRLRYYYYHSDYIYYIDLEKRKIVNSIKKAIFINTDLSVQENLKHPNTIYKKFKKDPLKKVLNNKSTLFLICQPDQNVLGEGENTIYSDVLRRTSLSLVLDDPYKLRKPSEKTDTVLCKNVLVIREHILTGYGFLKHPQKINILVTKEEKLEKVIPLAASFGYPNIVIASENRLAREQLEKFNGRFEKIYY